MKMTLQWIPESYNLGVTVADCQAACLKLPADQQALCLNTCIPPTTSTAKAAVTAGAALIIAAVAGVIGFLAGTWTTVAYPTEGTCNRCDEIEKGLRENPRKRSAARRPARRKKKPHTYSEAEVRSMFGMDSFVLQKFADGTYRAALYDDALKWSAFSAAMDTRLYAWTHMPTTHAATATEAVKLLEARAGRHLEPWSYREKDALKAEMP